MVERLAVVVATLRFLGSGWVDEHEAAWLREVADQIERDPEPAEWMCCPLCEEVTCDSNCPLESLR